MSRLTQALADPKTHAGVGVMLQAAAIAFPQYSLVLAGIGALFGFGSVTLPRPTPDQGTQQAANTPQ